MKKIVLILSLILTFFSYSQVRMTGTTLSSSNSSAFIDASSNTTNNGTVGTGKGLVFPRVDLSTFTFVGSTGVGNNYPTRYDGFIVYNTATSGTANVGSTDGTLSRGFWYYDNSTAGVGTGTTNGGTWKSLASGSSTTKDITSTEIELSTKVDGEQLYAIKGAFTLGAASSSVTFTIPTGMTGYYSFVTYKDGKTFRRDINSFTISDTTATVVFGTGIYSEVFGAATYNYVLEYFK